jgi:hypothetical protein
MSEPALRSQRPVYGVGLSAAIAALTLATAYIHSTLGGMLFTLNAIGYALLAVAIAVGAAVRLPIVVRFSWLPRLGLFAFTLTTIVGWLLVGARIAIAYLAKGIEVGILILLVVDSFRLYGGPMPMLIRARASVEEVIASFRRSGSRTR